jgi:hypothetical protein
LCNFMSTLNLNPKNCQNQFEGGKKEWLIINDKYGERIVKINVREERRNEWLLTNKKLG